jgi:hypothetical protein
MENLYCILAELTAFIHGVVFIFMFSGGTLFLLSERFYKKYCPLYVVFWIAVIVINVTTLISTKGKVWCILTFLENFFRKLSGDGVYSSGFITYYLKTHVNISVTESFINLMIGTIVGIIALTLMIRKLPKNKTIHNLQ